MKKLILPILAIFFAVMTLSFVSATTTLNTPQNNYNYSGTLNFNCTTDLPDALNASLYYSASGGAVDTILVTNDTAKNLTEFTVTGVDISSLSDATTYNVTCKVENSTASEESANITLTIDNTAPVISLWIKPDEVNVDRIFKYRANISDATSRVQLLSCNITDPKSGATNVSTNDAWYTYSQTQYRGNYNYTCTATDHAGNSAINSTIVEAKVTGVPTYLPEEEPEQVGGINFKTIAIIVVVLLIGWALTKRKR